MNAAVLEARRAAERLRYIRPDTAAKVLSLDRYWTKPFVDQYRSLCRALAQEDPSAAYQLSQHLDQLTVKVGVGCGPKSYVSPQDQGDARVLALSVQAVCAFEVGKLVEAEALLREAAELGRHASSEAQAEFDLLKAQIHAVSEG